MGGGALAYFCHLTILILEFVILKRDLSANGLSGGIDKQFLEGMMYVLHVSYCIKKTTLKGYFTT